MIAAVVAVFVTSTKTLAEVILIFGHIDIVSVIAIAGILKCVAVVGIKLPSVLLVSLARAKAFFVTRIDCASQQVRSILIHVVVLAPAIVAIVRSAVIIVGETLKPYLILAQTLPVTLLKTPLVQTPLLLQLPFPLAPPALPVIVPAAELIFTLTPGLFLATAPFVALLIRQTPLLIPTALVVPRLPLLITIPALIYAALSFPLTRLTVLPLLLSAPLLFS